MGTTPESPRLPIVYQPTGGGLERRFPGRGSHLLAYTEAPIDVLHSGNSRLDVGIGTIFESFSNGNPAFVLPSENPDFKSAPNSSSRSVWRVAL